MAASLRAFACLLGVAVVLVILDEAALVVGAERLQRLLDFALGQAEALQQLPRRLERGQEQLALHVGDAEVEQPVGVVAVAGAGVDRQVGVAALDQLGGAHRGLDVVDGEHERALVGLRRVEDVRPAGIAVEGLRAEALHELDLLGADVERGKRNALRPQHARDHLAKGPNPAMMTWPSLAGGIS